MTIRTHMAILKHIIAALSAPIIATVVFVALIVLSLAGGLYTSYRYVIDRFPK